jgi:endonuclease YncB( thermonuclease family)
MSRFRRARQPSEAPRRRSGWRRLADFAVAAALLVLLALVSTRLERFAAREVAGVPVVNDGDSLTFGAHRVRLRGIDAPEYDQTCSRDGDDYPCGRRARETLVRLIGQRPVDCQGWERDRYGRLLATCSVAGTDLNGALVSAGWAVAYGGYADEQAAAREARRGLWAGAFEQPRTWRERKGDLAEAQPGGFAAVFDWLRAIFGLS